MVGIIIAVIIIVLIITNIRVVQQARAYVVERLGAYKNFEWLRKPMIWAEEAGVRSSLTGK